MPRIVCHPDNLTVLRKQVDAGRFDDPRSMWNDFVIQTNSAMQREKPTGKYRLPDGRIVERDQIKLSERFTEYGPEDLDWLLLVGLVTEEKELLFYVIKDSLFTTTFNMAPLTTHRSVILMNTV